MVVDGDRAVEDMAVEDRAIISPLPLVAGPVISPIFGLWFLPLLLQQVPQVALGLLLLPGQVVGPSVGGQMVLDHPLGSLTFSMAFCLKCRRI